MTRPEIRKSPASMRRRGVFVAKFTALLIGFYVVIALNQVNDRVIIPFTEVVTSASVMLLSTFESGVAAAGTVMRSAEFALDVRNGCNGVEAAVLLASAILAFPATLRSRLIGFVVGAVAIELLNLVRLCSLFWLGQHHREIFDLFHVAVWQSLVIMAAIAIFMVWSLKFAEKNLADSR